MRKPFTIPVEQPDPSFSFCWRELCGKDHYSLSAFFAVVTVSKAREFAWKDGKELNALQEHNYQDYIQEARDSLYSLHNWSLKLDRFLPACARAHLPEIFRTFQSKDRVATGLLSGLHIGLLWRHHQGTNEHDALCGLAILEKTDFQKTAALSIWKSPIKELSIPFLDAVAAYMDWGKTIAGYEHFIAHIEAAVAPDLCPRAMALDTNWQRGNPKAATFAKRLGFTQNGTRCHQTRNRNGKETLIMTAKNWGRHLVSPDAVHL